MGNCFSDPSKSSGPGQKLGSGPASQSTTPQPSASSVPPRTLGGPQGGSGESDGDARDRALRAAEERSKAAQAKGVTGSNPRAGQLAAKLAAERRARETSPKQGDERMMDRGDWN